MRNQKSKAGKGIIANLFCALILIVLTHASAHASATDLVIALQADNGNYMARCNGCQTTVRTVTNSTIMTHVKDTGLTSVESIAKFTVKNAGDGKVALMADSGFYLGRCNGCVIGSNVSDLLFAHVSFVGDATMLPNFAKFTISILPNGLYTLRADNGMYVSRCSECSPGASYPDQVSVNTPTPNKQSQWALTLISTPGSDSPGFQPTGTNNCGGFLQQRCTIETDNTCSWFQRIVSGFSGDCSIIGFKTITYYCKNEYETKYRSSELCTPKTWATTPVFPGMEQFDNDRGLKPAPNLQPLDSLVTEIRWDKLPTRDGLYIFVFRAVDTKIVIRPSDRPDDSGIYSKSSSTCAYLGNPQGDGMPHMFVRHTQINGGTTDVWSAGQLEVHNGKIIWLSAASGHFRPDVSTLNYIHTALGLSSSVEHHDYNWRPSSSSAIIRPCSRFHPLS
jgi:hypothetical protein